MINNNTKYKILIMSPTYMLTMQDERMCACVQKQLDRLFQRLKSTELKLIKGEMKKQNQKKLKDKANNVSLQQELK